MLIYSLKQKFNHFYLKKFMKSKVNKDLLININHQINICKKINHEKKKIYM